MSAKALLTALPLCMVLVAGCTFPVRQQVDDLICDRSKHTFDQAPPKDDKDGKKDAAQEDGRNGADKVEIKITGLFLTDVQEPKKKQQDLFLDRTEVPDSIRFGARDIKLPGRDEYKKEIGNVIKEHFPPIPLVKVDEDFPPGPDGRPLSLSELQKIAFTNSPLLRQAASDIEAARGAAIQAGAYPNPILGYQSNSAGPGGGPNVGFNVTQTIKTFGKLGLAQAAALADFHAAEIAYRRAETDLLSNVRTSYYAVIVAQESIKANRGLVELTDEMYRVMVDQLRGGVVAPYEPNQVRVFSDQARAALLQARNSRLLAWRQLASAMGVPHMPPTALEPIGNRPVPRINFEKALAHVLTKHTDVLTTNESIEKARFNLRLAQVTPYPDVTVQAGVANDLTQPGPSRLIASVGASVPVPFFDQNKGAIRQAQAALLRANEEPHRVQADLASRFSEAYRRYEENRMLLEMYQKSTLPSQVQAFRSAVKRYFSGDPNAVGALAFNDVVTAEQNLVTVIGNYLPILQAQWQAVVDVSSLLQTNQLYQAADEINNTPAVDFEELLKLPCHHPCAPATTVPTRDSFRMEPATPSVSAPAVQPTPVAATFLTPIPVLERK